LTPRERAWGDIHELLPAGWRVGPPTYEQGRDRWSVTARSTKYSGRLRPQVETRLLAGAAYRDRDLIFATALGPPIEPGNFRRS